MLETSLQSRSAFETLLRSTAPAGLPGLMLRERTGLGLATLQVGRGQRAALGDRFRETRGLDLRDGAVVSQAGELSLVAIGPDNWLAVCESGDWRLSRELTRELDGLAAVCDQSSGYGVLRLSGPRVRETLAKGVPIDLDPAAFAPGDAAVTLAAHVSVILWQVDEAPTYDLAVSRSYAGSFAHWLTASAAEFGYSVGYPR